VELIEATDGRRPRAVWASSVAAYASSVLDTPSAARRDNATPAWGGKTFEH